MRLEGTAHPESTESRVRLVLQDRLAEPVELARPVQVELAGPEERALPVHRVLREWTVSTEVCRHL